MCTRLVRQFFHRHDVTVRQIHYVDVIAHASTVFGRIIVTKNRQRVATAYSNPGAMYGIRLFGMPADLRPYRPTDARQLG